MKSIRSFHRLSAGLVLASVIGGPSNVDYAYAEGSATALEEIVVTARKREESLQDIPIAISAVTADQLEQRGITKLEELTLQVAGVQYHSLGLAIPGRVNSSIRFRGMDVNSQVPTFQLGTLFVDGNYVLGGTHSIPLDDIERIEVVKGPQSAYFGRNTFGGAINYISKQPSLTELQGEVKALTAEYAERDISGSVSLPIITDKLAIRVGGRVFETGGMWRASDGGKLGAQSTDSYQAALRAQPIEGLQFTVRYFSGRDADGPAAGGAIPGRFNDTCNRAPVTIGGQTVKVGWFCGSVPEQGKAVSVLGTTKIIDSNTQSFSPRSLLATGNANYLLEQYIQRALPAVIVGKVPTVNGIELKREVERVSAKLSYEFNDGWSIEAQGGDNTLRANWVRDFNFTAFDNAYSRDPQYATDRSWELRLSSPQKSRFRWQAGYNRYQQTFISAATGGDSLFLCVDSIPGVTIGSCRANTATQPGFAFFPNGLGNTDAVDTKGLFAGATYDFSDQWSLSAEGRYQKDSFRRGTTTFQTVAGSKFLPRVIFQWKPSSTTNLYASYALGLLQGEINQLVIDADARERAQFEALGSPGAVPQEELASYELGWKQSFADGRFVMNSAFYYGDWSNKKIRQVVSVNFTCGDFPQAVGTVGCRPQIGEGALGEPAKNPNGTPVFSNQNVVSAYDAKIWGAEFEWAATPTDNLRLGGALTWARSEMKNGIYNTISQVAGTNDIKGKSNPRFPEWSGSINGEYTAPLSAKWNWFVRGDAAYFGKTYVDLDNLASCKGYTVANGGFGAASGDTRVEFFVRNLFNDDSWAACARFLEFDLPQDGAGNPNTYMTVIVAPQMKRQFGLRASYKF
jgi:iron complex outermembrane receptor protein